jgi:hypothetical protein
VEHGCRVAGVSACAAICATAIPSRHKSRDSGGGPRIAKRADVSGSFPQLAPTAFSRFRLRVLLVVIAVQTLTCGATEGELQCEEGVSHLAQCCPGFVASRVSCELGTTCSGLYPRLSRAESQCIEAMDCDTLIRNDVCGRIFRAPGTPVCP